MPPEIMAALVILIVTFVSGGTLIIRSASKNLAAKFDTENEKRKIELDTLKQNSIESATNSKFVLDIANNLSARANQQDKVIAGLIADKESQARALEAAAVASKTRDEQIGALQATLDRTATERDKEREQREKLETERNTALAQVETMKQKIADLEAKAAEVDKLAERVAYLEDRHKANNEIMARLADMEKQNTELKSELDVARRQSQSFTTPTSDEAAS